MSKTKKMLSLIFAAILIVSMLPVIAALATGEPAVTLGSAVVTGDQYYYANASVSGENIRTILISFSGSVTAGDRIVLPASTPAGFTVSASSAGNDYTKRINLIEGVAASAVQDYIRGIGFSIASPSQSVSVTVTTENILSDTFYNLDTAHYYQYIPAGSSGISWTDAYAAARNMTYTGRSGYLATVMSEEEDTYLNSLSGGKTGWLGGTIMSSNGGRVNASGAANANGLYYGGFTDNGASAGWYWACGPEIGTVFYSVNSIAGASGATEADRAADADATADAANPDAYYNWSRSNGYEPNNVSPDYENCLTTLELSGRTGKHGTQFTWNDIRYNNTDQSSAFSAKGYFVEYGNLSLGDNESGSTAFATASGALTVTATVSIYTDGAPSAAPGAVELRQSGSTVYTAASGGATGVYIAPAASGTYDVYVNSVDTGEDIVIDGAADSADINYYTVAFDAADAGEASGSTISATADGAAIVSGAKVLAGKAVVITAAGAGAGVYTYAWSGTGTGGQTSASLTLSSLSGAVDATCTVTGTTVGVSLGSAALTGDTYYYPNASVGGDGLGTLLISFSDNVSSGDRIVLPEAPEGFTVSSTSNDYTKRINLDSGVSAAAVQDYLRDVGFQIASVSQTVSVTVTLDTITVDTFYNINTRHYYQYIPSTTTNWIDAYSAARGMTYMGRTGYLATVMSEEEDTYLNSLSGGKTGWLGGTILSNSGTRTDASGTVSAGGLYYSVINTTGVVSSGWYWACGPEIGTTFFNTNSLYPSANASNAATVDAGNTSSYFNWARGTASYEPNNRTASLPSANLDYEACLTTLLISGNTGKHGTAFSWNDKHYTCTGTGDWDAKGYFIEYGDSPQGDSGGGSAAFAQSSGMLREPSGDISLTTVAWTGAASYTCGVDLPAASKMVTLSVDSGYFTVPSLGGALTFLGGTSGTSYISAYGADTHYDSAVFSFADASEAEALLSGILYRLDGTTPQVITATSSTVSPLNNDIYFEGHYYRYVDSGADSIDWPASVLAAGGTEDPYFGGRGYIATATSQAENSILLRLVENGAGGSDHWDNAWMGGLWQRNTGTTASPNIVRGIDGHELTFDVLHDAGDITALLKDYTRDFSFGFSGSVPGTFICNNYGTVRYYWIDGPEAGQELPNNTAGFAPWHTTAGTQDEPNSGDFIYIGWQGAYWDDLSAYGGDSGSAYDKLDGYIVEFSGYDGGTAAGVVREDTKTTAAYTATVNVRVDGALTAASGTVELRQGGVAVAAAASAGTGVYTATVHGGTYDIYICGADTGTDIALSGADNSAEVHYYTVSFSVSNAGTASGSTIAATADGTPIVSGTTVPAGKAVVITATGAGATAYAYAWSGNGTGGETTAALSITSLNGSVNAACTVTGTTLVTVTYDAEGAGTTPPPQLKQYGSPYGKASDGTTDEALPAPVRTGYTFGGWWTGDNGTGVRVTDATTVATAPDHTLYAKWTANAYTVTFNTNGGSAVNAVTQDYDTAIPSMPGTTKAHHTFSGWYGDAALTNPVTFPYRVTGDATLYAKWTTDTYTAAFVSGSSVYTVVSADSGETIAAPANPVRTGYTFGGWYKEPACTNKWHFSTDVITANLSLYAKWTVNSYTVTFTDWDGATLEKQTVQYGKAAEAPEDPERTGYSFTGWDKDYDDITSNTTLTAQYRVNTYTVTFNANGGSAVSGQEIEYEGSADKPQDPVRSGYAFGGWYSDSGLVKAYDFDAKVTANITLYAKWEEASGSAQAVAQSLTLETAFSFAAGDTWECVTSSFLMLGGANSGAQITWTSSDPEAVGIETGADGGATGVVTRPADSDASVVITATVTKGGDSVSKTFLLIVKRKDASKDETREATERAAAVRAGENTGGQAETIYTTTLRDGTRIDYVTVTEETVRKLIEGGASAESVVVRIERDADSPADEFAFEVAPNTVAALVQSGMGVTLESPAGSVALSPDALEQAAQIGTGLYFRIVPAADEAGEAEEAFRSDGAVFSLSGVTGQVFGSPKTIQTNMESFATTITLPLEGLSAEQLADAAFLQTLCVYVQHDDGTTELVCGTLVYTDGTPTGIRFDIHKFSRFQVVSVRQAEPAPSRAWILWCIAGALALLLILILLAARRKRRARTAEAR